MWFILNSSPIRGCHSDFGHYRTNIGQLVHLQYFAWTICRVKCYNIRKGKHSALRLMCITYPGFEWKIYIPWCEDYRIRSRTQQMTRDYSSLLKYIFGNFRKDFGNFQKRPIFGKHIFSSQCLSNIRSISSMASGGHSKDCFSHTVVRRLTDRSLWWQGGMTTLFPEMLEAMVKPKSPTERPFIISSEPPSLNPF